MKKLTTPKQCTGLCGLWIMNIFFLHKHPRRCARWHCDKHVVKMIVETCQLLYTCHWMVDTPDFHTAPFRIGTDVRGYKKTHWNHPCSKWVRQSLEHYLWLAQLGRELLREYKHRFASTNKIHACTPHIEWLSQHPPALTSKGWTPPPMAMPDEYKTNDVSSAYKKYYLGEKREILHYTRRHVPHWQVGDRTGCKRPFIGTAGTID
jgi:hypothetical protein